MHTIKKLASAVALATTALSAVAQPAAASAPVRSVMKFSGKVGPSLHQTAPTRFVEVNGVKLAYRRFGKPSGVPVVFFQHFLGNLDSWDPAVTDGFARTREVIIFDNAGVSSSGGEVPKTVEDMAKYGIGLFGALNIKQADILGFSLGSLIAQEVAIERPDLVRKVILVGSAPRGGVGMASLTPEFQAMLGKKHDVPDEILLDTFFTPSAESQAAGREFLNRIRARTVDRDAPYGPKEAPNEIAAFAAWGAPSADSNKYLKSLNKPVLVISGSNDVIHYTVNSFTLEQNLPHAQLIIYPDSAHGSFYQYPKLFLQDALTFLDQPV